MTSSELLLHPVRLRIVQAFLGDRALTTAQLGELLPDVGTTTLYRQVGTLADAGVLEVVGERRVRAVTERTYRLRLDATRVDPDEVARMTPEQHRQVLTAVLAGLLAGFERSVTRGEGDRQAPLHLEQTAVHLTDAEMDELVGELRAVVARYRDRPAGDRPRRLLTTVLLPSD